MPDDVVKDKVESDEKGNIDRTEENPQDLIGLWMQTRLLYSKAKSSQERYYCLIDCLDYGIAMLPDSEDTLRQDATTLISETKEYLKTRDIEYEAVAGVVSYRITGEEIGSIRVRPEDLEKGQLEAINQDCDRILPALKAMESKVMKALVKREIIVTKNWKPADLFGDKYYKKLLALKKKKQEEEEKQKEQTNSSQEQTPPEDEGGEEQDADRSGTDDQ